MHYRNIEGFTHVFHSRERLKQQIHETGEKIMYKNSDYDKIYPWCRPSVEMYQGGADHPVKQQYSQLCSPSYVDLF